MKKILAWLLCAVMILSMIPMSVFAAEGEYQSGNYIFTVSGSNATIVDYNGTDTSLSIPNSLSDYTVTAIGERAFYGSTTLTDVNIPSTVVSIGAYAFHDCEALDTVVIPTSVTEIGAGAFYNCGMLRSVTIPAGITVLGERTFANCVSLSSVSLPSTLQEIGPFAFYFCRSLSSVSLPAGVTDIGRYAFYYCTGLSALSLPNALVNIGEYAAYYCTGLLSVIVPASVVSVGDGAFLNCTRMTSAAFQGSGTIIGSTVFGSVLNDSIDVSKLSLQGYPSSTAQAYAEANGILFVSMSENPFTYTLNERNEATLTGYTGAGGAVVIPSTIDGHSVIGFATDVFRSNTAVTGIAITTAITAIPDNAFYGCTSLVSVTIPTSVQTLGSNVFYQCTSLTEITLPNSITAMGTHCFFGCSNLSGVTFSTGMTTVPAFTFGECVTLSNPQLPVSVTTIGVSAYQNCSSITALDFPATIVSIGDQAYIGCGGLVSATLNGNDTVIGSKALGYLDASTVSATLTIHGNDPSTAKTYADANRIRFQSLSSSFTTNNKPWRVIGIAGDYDHELSSVGFIAHLPYFAQAVADGSYYDYFIALDEYPDAMADNTDDTNFGSQITAIKPLYAYLQGHTYARSTGSAYIQDTENDMTFTGNVWDNYRNQAGNEAVGTVMTTSDAATIRMSDGTLKLYNTNVKTTGGGNALAISGGTVSSISGDCDLESTSGITINMEGGAITALSPNGDVKSDSNTAVFLDSGSGSSIGSITSGNYTGGGDHSAVYISSGSTVGTISGGTFLPGSTSYYGLENSGTINVITGGYFYGFRNSGSISNGIRGGTFDFTTNTSTTFSKIKGLINSSYIARLDSREGKGKYTIVQNSGVGPGTYIGKRPSGVTSVRGTSFAGSTTYVVGGSVTVSFDGNGATGGSTSEIATSDSTFTFPDCGYSKTGYTFQGWSTNAADTAGAAAGTAGTATTDTTYYAIWLQNTYSVTYNNNGVTDNQSVTHGTEITLPSPVRSGYSFTGWRCSLDNLVYAANDSYTVNRSATFTAQWVANTYIVTLNNDGVLTKETHAYATAITLPTPEKLGYTFDGWLCNANNRLYAGGDTYVITETASMVAQWSLTPYTVTYINGTEISTETSYYDSFISLGILTKVGYTLMGWLCSADGELYAADSEYVITGDVTFTAQWTVKSYQVTYSNNGTSTAMVDYGTTITLPTPAEQEGFIFGGWKSSANGKVYAGGAAYTVTAAITFTAQWTADSCTISYVNDTTTTDTVSHGTVITLTTPIKDGYTFDGWLCSADNQTYAGGASYTVTAAVTFTAQWTQNAPTGPVEAAVTFGHSMSLENRLSMAFLVRTNSIPSDATDIYMEVCRDDVNNDGKTEIITLYTANTLTDSALRFYYDGIAAAEMSVICYANVYYTSKGVDYISQEDQISVKAWAEGQLAKASTAAKLKTLLVDMLNYGASAQTKFGVATDTLANAGIDDYQNLGTQTDPSFVNVRAASGTGLAVATTLLLENAIEMVFKVPKASADSAGCTTDNMVLRVTRSDTGAVTEVTCSNVEASAYAFNFSGMATSEFGVAVMAQLYKDGEAVSIIRTFSIESYLAAQYVSSDATTKAMFNAMKKFSDSAAAYFG